MADHFDSLETRDPAARERDLFARLPAAIARAMTAPGWAKHLAALDPLNRQRLDVDRNGPRPVRASESARNRPVGNPGGVRGLGLVAKPAKPYCVVGDPACRTAGVDQVQVERRR